MNPMKGWAMGLDTKRKVIILGDIEMGAGDKFDDFPHTIFIQEFLDRYNTDRYAQTELDLVFNGDTFDFLKVDIGGAFPHLIDEYIAATKLSRIAHAHKGFFEAIEKFIEYGQRPRRVHFIVGNHDMELFFPRIQDRITKLCGGSGQIFFPGFKLIIRDLYIEHGNQRDSLFSVEPDEIFIQHENRNVLKLPWATVTLLNAILPCREELYMLDRIKPRSVLFQSLPELKEYVLGRLWRYWTKDYIRSSDPLKKVSWTMVRETLKRSFYAFQPDVEIDRSLDALRKQNPHLRTFVFGHLHEASSRSFGDRKVVQAGCFRDEFMLTEHDLSYRPIPKSFIEVDFVDNHVSTVHLMEIMNPHVALSEYPQTLDYYAKLIESRMGSAETRLRAQQEIQEHEAIEHQAPEPPAPQQEMTRQLDQSN